MNTPTTILTKAQWLYLGIIFLCGLTLRIAWGLQRDLNLEGGDGPFYLSLGQIIALGKTSSETWWNAVGPFYPIFIAVFYRYLPEVQVPIALRVAQSILDAFTCLIIFDRARRLFNKSVGFIAYTLIIFDLRFIIQPSEIGTESFFIFVSVVSLWWFIIAQAQPHPTRRQALIAYSLMLLFGLVATFTRPIALPIPFLLLATLFLPRPTWQQASLIMSGSGLIILVILGWGYYKYQTTGNFVIVSEGLTGNFWLGAQGDGQWHGYTHFTEALSDLLRRYNGRYAYLEDALKIIGADPSAYVRLLFTKFSLAYTQPYGTVSLGVEGESLKELFLATLRGQISFGTLLTTKDFFLKLYIYFFHYLGLIGGAASAYFLRREWLKLLPLFLPILYTSFTYTLLTIIPRYLFPIMPLYLILASATSAHLYYQWKNRA